MMRMRENDNDANKVVPAATTITPMGKAIESHYNNILSRSKELSSTTVFIVANQCIATPKPSNRRTAGVATTTRWI